MKKIPLSFLLLSIPLLGGCTGAGLAVGAATTAGIQYTRPDKPPPVDLSKQMTQHESWCYETLGDPECYAYPQPDAAGRLISVEPESSYPLTAKDYDRLTLPKQ